MHTLRVTQRAGEDGTLQLSVPLLMPGSEYEVVVVVHPKEMEPASQRETPRAVDYPPAPLSEELESVDWELQIESPPPRPSRMVMVKFEKGSCRPPRIVANPDKSIRATTS